MKEWNYKRNKELNPNKYTCGSDKKVWWICPKGHEYQATIGNRVRVNSGCPYCANKKVLKGYNDLASTDKRMLNLWNWSKNSLTPYEVTRVSGKKVWWQCPKGHEWQDTIAHVAYGRNCPYCHNESSTSFSEQAIFYYLNMLDNTVYNRFKFKKSMKLMCILKIKI